MRKIYALPLALLALVAAGWTGLWFYGKGRIVQEVETQAQAIRDEGGTAAYESIAVTGFPFGYTTRIVAPKATFVQEGQSPIPGETLKTTYEWTAPWVRAQAGVLSPRTATITAAETQDLIVTTSIGADMEPQTIPLSILSDDMVIEATLKSEEDITFDVDARILTVSAADMTGLTGIGSGTYTMRGLAGSGQLRKNESGKAPLLLTQSTYTVEGFEAEAIVTGDAAVPGGRITVKGGAVRSDVDWFGPETTGGATLSDVVASFDFPMLGDAPLDIQIGNMVMQSSFPSEAGPEPQDFSYVMGIDSVTLSDNLWAMIDPQEAFPREIDTVRFDLSGDAVFKVSLSDPDAFAAVSPGNLPIEVRTVDINDLTIAGLGLNAAGTGTGTLGGAAPEGTATLGIQGFPGFMSSLVKSGRIPPQQAMVAQMMVESFGKMDEDGQTIRFDFEAREGMMYVNAIPIGQAPTMP